MLSQSAAVEVDVKVVERVSGAETNRGGVQRMVPGVSYLAAHRAVVLGTA
jgi:hypothetical protein